MAVSSSETSSIDTASQRLERYGIANLVTVQGEEICWVDNGLAYAILDGVAPDATGGFHRGHFEKEQGNIDGRDGVTVARVPGKHMLVDPSTNSAYEIEFDTMQRQGALIATYTAEDQHYPVLRLIFPNDTQTKQSKIAIRHLEALTKRINRYWDVTEYLNKEGKTVIRIAYKGTNSDFQHLRLILR